MKEKVSKQVKRFILALTLLCLSVPVFSLADEKPFVGSVGLINQRYTLFEAPNSPTMLLDTKTGLVWYSNDCNLKEGQTGLRTHSNCWILMTYPQGSPPQMEQALNNIYSQKLDPAVKK